jgi:hypothetical protein
MVFYLDNFCHNSTSSIAADAMASENFTNRALIKDIITKTNQDLESHEDNLQSLMNTASQKYGAEQTTRQLQPPQRKQQQQQQQQQQHSITISVEGVSAHPRTEITSISTLEREMNEKLNFNQQQQQQQPQHHIMNSQQFQPQAQQQNQQQQQAFVNLDWFAKPTFNSASAAAEFQKAAELRQYEQKQLQFQQQQQRAEKEKKIQEEKQREIIEKQKILELFNELQPSKNILDNDNDNDPRDWICQCMDYLTVSLVSKVI